MVDLDVLTSRLYTVVDDDMNYYFCLDESKYYPKGEFDYELDPDYVYTGDIIWLINNFYEQQELSNSPIEDFKNANFKTQYAATQLAIWSITDPKTYAEDPPKSVLENNPLIVELMKEAAKHEEDKNPSFEDILEQLEQTYIHVSDLVSQGEVGDAYAFESTITDNLTNGFTISNEQVKLEIALNTGSKLDITDDSKIILDKTTRKIHVEIPKTIINENKDKGELLLTASATIESKNKYYLRYTPVGASLYQPLATRNTLQKNVVDFGTVDVAGITSISVYKEWDDSQNQDGIRPASIEVQLLANGKAYESKKELNKSNDWAYSWNNLPQTDDDNEPIKYTVSEITKIPGYDSTVTNVNDNLYKITNKYIPKLINISGKKTWNDNNNQDGIRPSSIEVQLYANGVYLTSKTTTENNNWAYEFTNLPQFDNGKKIEYTIAEVDVPNYDSKVDDYNLTNTYTPGKTSVTVTKNWDDENNQDGIRPADIRIQLYANDEPVGKEVVLNEANKWTKTWDDLDEKSEGKTIVYSVKEVTDLGEYAVAIDDDKKGNIIITNQYTPELIDLKGEKVWDDKNNQDGKRPEKVVVNLLANGKQIDSKEVNKTDNWAYEFTKLPKYEDGVEIQYTVTENTVPEYSTEIDGTTITNHYTPGKTSVTVTKNWDDENNQDGIRPADIRIQLYANDEPVGKEVVLNEANKWTKTWDDLDEKSEGKTIVYSVKEVTDLGEYAVTIDDDNKGNIIITNQYTPETIDIEGEKEWVDDDDRDGKRPEKIIVNLLANGDQVDERIITEKEDWAYEFTDLPKYENGEEIIYTVTENQVNNYSTKISDTNIKNSYTPGKTSATVTKRWKDDNDKNGKRPTSISVQLYGDGKAVGSKEKLNKSNKWTKTWTDLDETKDGKKIVYTVKETTTIKNYEVSVDSSNIGNMIVTNEYVGIDDCESKENESAGGDSTADNCEAPKVNTPTEKVSLPKVSTTNKGTLPKTGSSYTLLYVFAGTIIIIAGLINLRKRKIKR